MAWQEEVANDELTGTILDVAYSLHTELGPGLEEHVYRDILAKRLRRKELEVEVEHKFDISAEGEVVGERYADLMVEGEVLLELKVVNRLSKPHYIQLQTNVRHSQATRGLLINFGALSAEARRVVHNYER